MAEEIVPNSVGWYILEGYPWWPVYICDVFKLRPTLHLLGSGHKKILKKARDFPEDFIVVYYFGSHDFSLVGLKKGVLRPWDCAQKDQFLKGHPQHLAKKKGVMEDLTEAVQEVEEYLSQPEDIRLPQHMVPSDLDPTLEPPPPELVPQEEAADPDNMDDFEPVDEDDVPEDDEEEKKRKKKDKKDKKKKEKVKKEKKDKKRKSESTAKKTSPKVAKTLDTDAKSQTAVKEPTEEKKPPPSDLTTEALSIVLEKEIRWILVNCPFEEMTTKTVRKLLEDRLHMDLRHHKASIKEGVARVIASMEEEDAADSTSTASEDITMATDDAGLKAEPSDAAVPVTPEATVKEEESVGDAPEDATERTKLELEAASKNLSLALELESKIMDALDPLKTLDSVEKDVLATSTLQPRLVKLRAHRSSKISDLVTLLVKKWNVEDLVPAPKPIRKEEILELKLKVENADTSHDEMLVCLNQLGEMPLTIDHLKKTGIARAVSKLRQHGNDKVSAKAHELRQKWIKQINEQSADHDSGSNPLKTLKTLNRVLDHHGDGTDEHKLHNKQLAALEQLHSMTLNTQDIIDSKVGISVSKLRKSSDEKVAKSAKKLRKKWQAEAKAKSSA
ncbi:TFIIS helical bundle-like domain [Phytophthora infestans]|uniref:TFIIS helical bundle-like domain n=1 Tax=Phytophthora infestans TaxID=4787 RepID=A0A833SVI1_PHYIN|nr:TFIIS helical bundle-like domain [Phytophthora infestans]